MHFHIWSIMSLLAVFPSFSSLEEEFPVRSARTPVRCSRELEDLRQQKCLNTDRRMDRPYCTAHRLLSACLSALPWGQAPNCWSWRNSVSLVGSHPDGVLFLAPSSNPCLILNKCLNSSSEHGPHPNPPSSAHPQPMWYRHASVYNALSLYNGAYVMELPQPPSSLTLSLLSLSFWGACLSSVSFISAMCTALSIMLTDLCNEFLKSCSHWMNRLIFEECIIHCLKLSFIISVEMIKGSRSMHTTVIFIHLKKKNSDANSPLFSHIGTFATTPWVLCFSCCSRSCGRCSIGVNPTSETHLLRDPGPHKGGVPVPADTVSRVQPPF